MAIGDNKGSMDGKTAPGLLVAGPFLAFDYARLRLIRLGGFLVTWWPLLLPLPRIFWEWQIPSLSSNDHGYLGSSPIGAAVAGWNPFWDTPWLAQLLATAKWLAIGLILFRLNRVVLDWPQKLRHRRQKRGAQSTSENGHVSAGDNRDGFPYGHLVLMALLTGGYLVHELGFNARLIEIIGGTVDEMQVEAIEQWGRTISGIAVSLLFVGAWLRNCEFRDRPIRVRIWGAIAITVVCVKVTWDLQGALIDFYVSSPREYLLPYLTILALYVATLIILVLVWLVVCIRYPMSRVASLLAFVPILVVIASFDSVEALRPGLSPQVGVERQHSYLLTLVRKAVSADRYEIDGLPLPRTARDTPEGMAFMAMFPIFGEVVRPREDFLSRHEDLVWYGTIDDEGKFGKIFDGYQKANKELCVEYTKTYVPGSEKFSKNEKKRRKAAHQEWAKTTNEAFGVNLSPDEAPEYFPPGMSRKQFAENGLVAARFRGNFLRDANFPAGCCTALKPWLDRDEFLQSVYPQMVPELAAQEVMKTDDPRKFGNVSDDGSTSIGAQASRAFWVPFWALVFSMLGALTHLWKTLYFILAYLVRATGLRLRGAPGNSLTARLIKKIWPNETPVMALEADHAAEVEVRRIHWLKIGLALGIALISVAIYYATNRINGPIFSEDNRDALIENRPVVGRLSYWAVNMQHFAYPINKAAYSVIMPTFESSPKRLIQDWLENLGGSLEQRTDGCAIYDSTLQKNRSNEKRPDPNGFDLAHLQSVDFYLRMFSPSLWLRDMVLAWYWSYQRISNELSSWSRSGSAVRDMESRIIRVEDIDQIAVSGVRQ